MPRRSLRRSSALSRACGTVDLGAVLVALAWIVLRRCAARSLRRSWKEARDDVPRTPGIRRAKVRVFVPYRRAITR
jgi:hypothetical protein